MLGENRIGLHGESDSNRSLNSWQVEENADKYGRRDAIADMYNNASYENMPFFEPHKFGDSYYPSVFLDIEEEKVSVANGTNQHKVSFDLAELVLSTGKGK